VGSNRIRCDVQNLLTQRAIQSFMYLSDSLRDPHSVRWIENFLNTTGSLEYHGVGAGYLERFGGTWEAPLEAMMQAEKDVVIVAAKRRGRGHGGWSKDNPFLEERFVEFEIPIDPVSLAARILAVREQIANEWVTDLDVLQQANEQILDSYFATAVEERTGGVEGVPVAAFERTAVNLLNNHTGFSVGASSPFRKGNFDLLYNICTQTAIHRLLSDLSNDSRNEVPYQFLRDFYAEFAAEYFDGDQQYGRADDFLEQVCSWKCARDLPISVRLTPVVARSSTALGPRSHTAATHVFCSHPLAFSCS